MDPATNPYAPGAGYPPPVLEGRDALIRSADIALRRVKEGRPAKSFIGVGLRGVGKTVVLNRIQSIADGQGYHTAFIEAYDEIKLADAVAKAVRPILLRLDRAGGTADVVKRGLRVLRSFASAFKVVIQGIELSVEAEAGSADSGDLAVDLTDLFLALGEAARHRETAVAIIVDEVQYLDRSELAALIMAIHRVNQKQLPLTMFGAGLPQVRGKMGESKSYTERLFDFPSIDALSYEDASSALAKPAAALHVNYDDAALEEIYRVTQGYPYFLQEWGHVTWLAATRSPITREVVEAAYFEAIHRLDESFFRVRLDRMTPTEKKYMRALAELGSGPHRSGDIARVYGAQVNSVAPIKANLVAKGMIYSPAHGDTAFTVPLFDDFMRREIRSVSGD